MKRLFLTAMLIMVGFVVFAQSPQTYQKNGKTYIKIEETQSRSKSTYIPTGMYVELDGKEYQVYSHVFTKGERQWQTGYFIQAVSKKSGKTYWKEVVISKG